MIIRRTEISNFLIVKMIVLREEPQRKNFCFMVVPVRQLRIHESEVGSRVLLKIEMLNDHNRFGFRIVKTIVPVEHTT